MARFLESRYSFTLQSLFSTVGPNSDSYDWSPPPCPSECLGQYKWEALCRATFEAIFRKVGNQSHQGEFSLHSIPRNHHLASVLEEELRVRLRMTQETNPGMPCISGGNHKQIGRLISASTNRKEKDMLMKGQVADEKQRYKKIQFTEISGVSSAGKISVH